MLALRRGGEVKTMIIAGRHLKMYFPVKGVRRAYVRAVDDVNIEVAEGEIVGLVGESGSGKTTLGRMLIRLLEPTAGEVLFKIPDGELENYDAALERNDPEAASKIASKYSVLKLKGRALKGFRREVGIVFQDPYSSLDPRLTIADIIAEPMIETGFADKDKALSRVYDLLEEVQLPREFAERYPHELSGGQRQRVAIARGIATNPRFVVLDEPTSALDVSVQAEILELLKGLREKYNMAMLLITHNISVVSYMADRIYVMYAGKLMERGPKAAVIRSPAHPYTQALISSVPQVGKLMRRVVLKGDVPSLVNPPRGCRFHPRCPVAVAQCGWTADEVAEALRRLAEARYVELSDRLSIKVLDEATLVVTGVTSSELKSIVDAESDTARALKSIDSLKEEGGGVLVKLANYMEPPMRRVSEGHYASCLLINPKT
jgi:peptide/nickel transport system ATP-binding protein